MDTVSEPDPGLTMEPEDKSLDPRKTSHRRFALKSCNIVLLIFGLLSFLLISLQFSSVMPTEEEEEAPSITEFHSSTHVLPVGQTARYTCHAGGTPEPTVEWLHNGRPLERNSTVNQSEAWVERGFLFVRGGRYGVNTVCCMASNSAGTANHSAELLVFDACDLTLDPNTAHRRLSLSEDNRKVTRVEEDQSYPDHQDRFDYYLQVLGREALTGRCYWEVEWEGRVVIGVTYRGITRRGRDVDGWLGQNNKSWVLYCTDGLYAARYNGREAVLPLPPAGSTRVGVYLDRPAGSLSFYRVSPGGGGSSDTLTHLHTFWSSFTQEDLLPGVRVRWGGGVLSLSVSVVENKNGRGSPGPQ
ncbi:E3 ubiquitin-protein ligase Midline-1-like [Gadus chalcogrammus]|uniref:E3 ubiquitin-protein ligase Midline-1-like n=1 Tax=Gadus chalcogrammus TaxID=1042646 RepID=UPI0024C23113|nr:E3 ubiquitin-protein ligase Midline-1-like [Gadus chalcogrammus]